MKPAKSQFASLVVAVSILFGTLAAAQMGAPTAKSETALAIEKALASPIRTAEERARDNLERKPVQTLEFFGLQPNMTVVEIMPGAGWYTKVLGQVLADKGTLHVSIGASRLAPRLKEWGLDKVKVSDGKFVTKPSGQRGVFDAESIEIPVQNADLVLTFRNLHNMTPGARALVNKAVFDTLKPGGVYGVVDHTRRHNEPTSPENWRRIDPVVVIKEALDAGFVFEAFSDLHYRPDDELKYDSQRPSIAGYSDRFTLKFRKPAR
ncbi:MAG: class I SAM-dependent methyltransferase [Gammaproteobacteria bacterium]|nr:class I SAM-dependent methyltransferase [Gammaproteobacteria bacterium]MBM4209812.1 class I SAM-dependent methyltransferase [Gammaproteobacteria bacterium]MBM4230976.1 class I SAM-dependent methyltransferase [Gammaproteobacteria bacterium]